MVVAFQAHPWLTTPAQFSETTRSISSSPQIYPEFLLETDDKRTTYLGGAFLANPICLKLLINEDKHAHPSKFRRGDT
jgi:hypothetical protein